MHNATVPCAFCSTLNRVDLDRLQQRPKCGQWCAPCRMMAPALDEVAHEHAGRVLIAKLDTDKNQATATRFGIRGIPTLIVFENGVEKTRQSGAMRREQIESLLGLNAGRA